MEMHARWKQILFRSRKLLSLDIEHSSPLALRNIILDVRTPASILDRIAQVYYDDEYILRDLVRCPNLSETTLAFISLTASDEIRGFICGTRVMDVVMAEGEDPAQAVAGAAGKKKLNVIQQIQMMTPAQRIKLALAGAKEARGILVKSSNKMISLAVLENPRLTDGEVESFAKSQNLSEDVMRKIATNSEWSKRYPVAQALVFNPKTPPGLAIGFVNRMRDQDLAMLEKNKNVSEAVRSAARGLIMKKKLGKK
jgi:hypothetical protein